ncbi:MAG: bifunctional phosphopantothenoylcysteine decarboxylase/phosphopantothenate--cysteine ligase CoaBC [Candidatus Marinimicrobia bacterium]|nr:bifunctional phosphopantothenoylcysteine decarboxylase/phosphopantothenate--cysteine ligase CoaBC [Candidatus Neomarinimicrobiota bacterium]
MSILRGKKIVLGLTGGIAIYKSASLLRRLIQDLECDVTVVMTKSAQEFMTPMIFETFTGKEVITDMFKAETDIVGTRHIDITQSADLVAIIPATANIIGKISGGIADDALSTMLLVAKPEKTVIAPAMNKNMYLNAVVQRNLQQLRDLNYQIIEPDTGELATAEEGWGIGRLPDEKTLIHFLEKALSSQKKTLLQNKRILITGGPTREAIDDIRFISNPSTGKMGIALAEAAARSGAIVNYISGPTALPDPQGCNTQHVVTAEEMKKAVLDLYKKQDIVVMAAAVEDIRPVNSAEGKLKKDKIPESLKLEKTDDILLQLGKEKKQQILVGFSVEVENELNNSISKMEKKNLDWIVVNNPRESGSAFATNTNQVTIINKKHKMLTLPLQSKADIAEAIWQTITKSKD